MGQRNIITCHQNAELGHFFVCLACQTEFLISRFGHLYWFVGTTDPLALISNYVSKRQANRNADVSRLAKLAAGLLTIPFADIQELIPLQIGA